VDKITSKPQSRASVEGIRYEWVSSRTCAWIVTLALALIVGACNPADIQATSTMTTAPSSGLAKTSEPESDISALMKDDPSTVDPIDSSGERAEAAPLVQAAANGDLDGVLFLLSDGEDPNLALTKNGWTPLMSAAFNGFTEVAAVLIDAGADVDRGTDDEWTPLMGASQNGYENVVALLLANGANPRIGRSTNWTALHSATFNGHVEVVRQLIMAGAPFEAAENGFTPLTIAAQEGNGAIILLLLNAGAEVEGNAEGSSPTTIASQNGHVSSLEMLLAAGADPDRPSDGYPPIVIAAQRGHAEVIKTLSAADANLDQGQASDGVTALHWAAYNGDAALVILLLDLGADRTVKDLHGRYPRDIAVERGYLDLAEQLALSGSP